MLCDNLVIFLLFLCDWDWIIKCKMNFHDVSHIWSLQTESWRHHDPSPIFPYQKFYQLEAQVTSHGGLCVDWGHDTQCNIGQGYSWYDVSQSLFIITVCWNVCPPHSLLTISIVGLPHYLWLTGLQWVKPVYTSTDCTVVHTSWSHSHLTVHFTHMCVWDQTLVQLHTIAIVSNSQWSSTNSLLYSIHICLPFLHRFSIIMYYNLVIYSMKWNSFMNVTFYLFVYCSSWMDKGTN